MTCKIIMTIVPLVSVLCSVMFAISREDGYQYEWFAVATAAIFVGCFIILFKTDPCDDELQQFFCCKKKGPAITEL
jgi:bacteriorhodopsin